MKHERSCFCEDHSMWPKARQLGKQKGDYCIEKTPMITLMSYALQIPGNILYHTDDIMDRFTINITTIIEADITQVGF